MSRIRTPVKRLRSLFREIASPALSEVVEKLLFFTGVEPSGSSKFCYFVSFGRG